MDAPSDHPDLNIPSAFNPPVARMTITVMINCQCELQYFLNLDVAKSAAAASTWHGKIYGSRMGMEI